ncbi:hypothetical protein [Mangrovicoccus sp. HB161399]|uniref:hypothetical protein n=1 Tax=Mangrovicoccus sp. HB161399 TaxID=2720392 RepID=UPI0015536BEC|nr:hypothetical protein [Mangrovicoccus sp. HB161399]
MPDIDDMGFVNRTQGVCGFAAALYALYAHSPTLKDQQALSDAARWDTRIAAEIKTYLMILKAERNERLLGMIQTFCAGYPGLGGFTMSGYIEKINSIPENVPVGASMADKEISVTIALPPPVLADYLRRVCGFRNATEVAADNGRNELIVGVQKGDPAYTMYGGLCHYIYRLGGTWYTWGGRAGSLEQLNRDYDRRYVPCCYVSPVG